MSGNRTLHHAIEAEEPYLGWQKISATNITQNIWLPNTLDSNPLDYILGTVEQETIKTLWNIKAEFKARIMVAFSNFNQENLKKSSRRFQSHLQAAVEANGSFIK